MLNRIINDLLKESGASSIYIDGKLKYYIPHDAKHIKIIFENHTLIVVKIKGSYSIEIDRCRYYATRNTLHLHDTIIYGLFIMFDFNKIPFYIFYDPLILTAIRPENYKKLVKHIRIPNSNVRYLVEFPISSDPDIIRKILHKLPNYNSLTYSINPNSENIMKNFNIQFDLKSITENIEKLNV